jgi:transketolase
MMQTYKDETDQRLVAVIKGLVMDATRKASSGHPGGAFSSADFAAILFREYLRFAPKHPKWHNRDRFVLSAGHESMLLYSLLHLMGLLSLDEIKAFRQFGSLTPGHPETQLTPGVEATTGPLGQGIAMAVGMAVAQQQQQAALGREFGGNRVYCLVGDGDLQEDVALGACQLAGHWALHSLVVYYDKNDQQISGNTGRVSSVDFPALFRAMQWEVLEIDGHDHTAIRNALDFACSRCEGKPLLIIGQTIMAKGAATMEGSHKTHGEPLKPDEIAATKLRLGLDPEEFFQVPSEVVDYFQSHLLSFNGPAEEWNQSISGKRQYNAEFREVYDQYFGQKSIELAVAPSAPGTQVATRVTFGKALESMGRNSQSIMGGSADLEPTNNTAAFAVSVGEFSASNRSGRNLAFGVREFPMTAIGNGMALYGGFLPFGATFLTFSDYSRNAIRMSALMELPALHVFTHDSIFLGEDGPTHQSVEHLMSLRLIPQLQVCRPADERETLACMRVWGRGGKRPMLLALTRQAVPVLEGPVEIERGAYVCCDTRPEEFNRPVDLVIYASGSEVWVAREAALRVSQMRNIRAWVVSVVCWLWFEEQDEQYREFILQKNVRARVSIEAGSTLGWQRFTGMDGLNIGVDGFGHSAPAEALATHFGLLPEQVTDRIEDYLNRLGA